MSYAVSWRRAGGPVSTGRLVLGPTALRLRGRTPAGEVAVERLRYEDVSAVRIDRAADEWMAGRRLVLDGLTGGPLVIASIDGLGIVHELADRVAELSLAHRGTSLRIAVVVPLRDGGAERARALLEEGPPFDPGSLALERHHVFLTEHEAVFLFEGPGASDVATKLVQDPAVWKAAAAWRRCVAGPPRLGGEAYAWVRPGDLEAGS